MSAYFDVRPRYTGGSPAMVDERTARRVARQEADAYPAHLEGWYGPEAATDARERGLAGIVLFEIEHRSGWVIYDLLTRAWTFQKTYTAEAVPCPEDLRFRYSHKYSIETAAE